MPSREVKRVRNSAEVPLDTPRGVWLMPLLLLGQRVTEHGAGYPHIHGTHRVPARIVRTAAGAATIPAVRIEVWRIGCPACPVSHA